MRHSNLPDLCRARIRYGKLAGTEVLFELTNRDLYGTHPLLVFEDKGGEMIMHENVFIDDLGEIRYGWNEK